MTIEEWKNEYPKLFSRLPEDIDELRYLMVIDENIHDGDVDELDEIDSEEYNYLIYLTETFQEALGGESRLIELIRKLDEHETFEDFFPSELDLYGIKTDIDENQIAKIIFDITEEMLS